MDSLLGCLFNYICKLPGMFSRNYTYLDGLEVTILQINNGLIKIEAMAKSNRNYILKLANGRISEIDKGDTLRLYAASGIKSHFLPRISFGSLVPRQVITVSGEFSSKIPSKYAQPRDRDAIDEIVGDIGVADLRI